MLIQEVHTDLAPSEVIEQAKQFFTTRFTPYTGFLAEESDHSVKFMVEAGEVVIGAVPQHGRTLVRGSSSRLNHEVGQFLATLAPPEEVRESVPGPGSSGAG